MKKREGKSLLGRMVGKSMSGGTASRRGRCRRRRAGDCRRRLQRHIEEEQFLDVIDEEQFLDVAFDVDKVNRESIIEEREKEKEVFEDAEEEMVG